MTALQQEGILRLDLDLEGFAGIIATRVLRSSVVDHGAGLGTIRSFDNRAKTIMIPMRDFEMFDT